ncbi:MAG: glycine--tRNA ligase subunit beta [Pseudomonadota bacterium]
MALAELLIELFSEEIPARMQKNAALHLEQSVCEKLKAHGLKFDNVRHFYGPRRLTLVLDQLPLKSDDIKEERRGPKVGAPDKAIEGFLRSTGLKLDDLEEKETPKGQFYFAYIFKEGRDTKDIIADFMPEIIQKFPWPKSMCWGSGKLQWVRPLHNVLCLLSDEKSSEAISLQLENVSSEACTYGHHFMDNSKKAVKNFADYAQILADAHVVFDHDAREAIILKEIDKALKQDLEAANLEWLCEGNQKKLLSEVTGLVEYPTVLIGDIAEEFQSLPNEVLDTSMRVHQKYFSVYNKHTQKITKFITIANVKARDGGAQILKGNQRVLAARLADAKYFYDLDLKKPLSEHSKMLQNVTYHADMGSQALRVQNLTASIAEIATQIGADREKAIRSASLCKADLMTEMVGEFPELQGIMGYYYAIAANEDQDIAHAIKDHYLPAGPDDVVPDRLVTIALGLADRLQQLIGFWAIDAKPTGSKDPYALRRAAIGLIRLLSENNISYSLPALIDAVAAHHMVQISDVQKADLLIFITERLKVYLRDQDIDHRVIDALLCFAPLDIAKIVTYAQILNAFLGSDAGRILLESYKRAVNILKAEESKDQMTYDIQVNSGLFADPLEGKFFTTLQAADKDIQDHLRQEAYEEAMIVFSGLKNVVFDFFENIIINSDKEELRVNRLKMLAYLRDIAHRLADFSKI